MKILDVGCGDAKVAGAIGVDCANLPGVDVVHNLRLFPWPFADESFDEIYMNDVIEHFSEPIKVMEECHRLLKKDGLLKIRVVYWNHKYAYSDPQHQSFFTEITWDFFTGKRKGYYTNAQFNLMKFQYIFDGDAKKIFRFEWLMQKLSKYLCNIIQGMDVHLSKK